MLRNGYTIIAFLAALTPVARAASAPAAATFFYTPLSTTGSDYYGMHQRPALDQALILKLQAAAQAQAEQSCRALFGEYTTLEIVRVGDIRESILAYHLDVDYLCGRSVSHAALVVPSLVTSVTGGDYDLKDVALPLLLKTGDFGALALLDVAQDIGTDLGVRSSALEALGSFIDGQATDFSLRLPVMQSMIDLIRETTDAEIVYYGAESVTKSQLFAKTLADNYQSLPLDRLGQLVYASAQHFDATTYWAVGADVYSYLLQFSSPELAYYPTLALAKRGLKAEELEALLPFLAPLASPANEILVDQVFAALAAAPVDARILPLLVNALDPLLLESNRGQSFVFQAMLALRKYSTQAGAEAATAALQAIAASPVNPQNPYLQNLAKELLQAIAG